MLLKAVDRALSLILAAQQLRARRSRNCNYSLIWAELIVLINVAFGRDGSSFEEFAARSVLLDDKRELITEETIDD